MKREENRGTC